MSRAAKGSGALWWLDPRFVLPFLSLPFLVAAYLVPESTYITLYGSEKHVDPDFLVQGFVVYLGLIAGSFFAVSGNKRRPQEEDIRLYCRGFVWVLFAFTVFGYVTWFAYAGLQAGGPGQLASALVDLIRGGGTVSSDYVKYDLFQTLPGITTFTQFGILYATVEALLWTRSRSRLAVARFSVVVAFTLLRGVLLSERLAILEVCIPLAVVLLGAYRPRPRWHRLVRLVPLFLGAGVFGLFAFAEYFRSWASFYRDAYSGPYLEFALQRFLGYYVTAVNNAAVSYYYEPLQPLRNTLESLFRLPLVGETLTRGYFSVFRYSSMTETKLLLDTYANPEFNNIAAVGELLNDYSVLLAPVVAFFIGLFSGSLHRSFVRGRLIGALLYPSWFVGLLEVSRVYYWSSQRYFPVLAFLVISLPLCRLAKVPVRRPLDKSFAGRERHT